MVAYLLRRLQMIFDVIKKAKQLFYDNKNSGLDVSNVQDAIDDLTQAIVDVDAINEGSGESILLTDTLDDTVLDFKAYGRSEQKQYSGKNLLDCNSLAILTMNGITFTPVYDNSGLLLYINVNGTATDYAMLILTKNFTLPSGTYTLNGCPNGGSEGTYRLYTNATYNLDIGEGVTFTLDSEHTFMNVVIYLAKGTVANNLKFYPMISTEGGDYEPYVGGVAAPNPDYPQEIVNVSRSYFDGELFQGIRDSNGTLVANADSGVTNTNLIPCNVGVEIKVTYAENAPSLGINFYDEAKKRVSGGGSVSGKNEITYKATNANARYCAFYVGGSGSGITPANAKKITVAINGKECVLEVKSKGKNLLKCNKLSATTMNGVTFTPVYDDNGSLLYINANGTATEYAYTTVASNLTFPSGTYILSGCPSGGGENTYRMYTNSPNFFDYGNGVTFTLGSEYTFINLVIYVYKGQTLNNLKFYPMIRRAEVTDDTYEPYKEKISYIPLSAPLRSSLDGSVTDVVSLGECKVDRKNGIVNAKDLTWSIFTYGTAHINTTMFKSNEVSDMLVTNGNIVDSMCNRFNTLPNGLDTLNIDGEWTIHAGNKCFYICINNDRASTVDKLLAWLDSNPTYFQYLLAEPIIEVIEPVDIVTYDNVTYISNADNADMWVEYYSNTGVGQRLAKTDEQMRAMRTELDNMIPTTTGTGAVFCKSGNVVVLHLNGVTTRIDNKSRCLLDISTDVFAQFPPVYVSATKPTQYLVVFRDSETNAVSTAVAKIIQDNGRYYVQILPIMSGTLADNADGTVNGTITYLTDRSI